MVKLKTPIKRELQIGKTDYVLTVSAEGLKLVLKGKRNGLDLAWRDLVSGDAAMAVALRASLNMLGAAPLAKPKRRATK